MKTTTTLCILKVAIRMIVINMFMVFRFAVGPWNFVHN